VDSRCLLQIVTEWYFPVTGILWMVFHMSEIFRWYFPERDSFNAMEPISPSKERHTSAHGRPPHGFSPQGNRRNPEGSSAAKVGLSGSSNFTPLILCKRASCAL
jgi:hypothetical protein